MNKNEKYLAWGVMVVLITLSGCASTYKASERGARGTGYSEKRISDGVYKVRFNGLANENVDNLLVHWNRRAAELCGENNYSGTAEKKENKDVVMMYSMGVMYPETVIHPYVEGKVECNDKNLATYAGPSKYYPTEDFRKLRLHSITAPGIESGEGVSDSFEHHVTFELERNQSEEVQPAKYYLDIVITRFIADGWSSTWLMGGMSGGTYEMTSVIKIQDVDSGEIISEYEIETTASAEGQAEYRLKKNHARELMEYAISIFGG